MAEVCLGGLGVVGVTPDATFANWPFSLTVRSSQPVIACLGSQYAGWKLQSGAFFALGSGPARALAAKEELYAEIGYRDEAETAVLVIEAEGPPPADIVDEVADACRISPSRLSILFAPTRSLAGSVQVVARSLEVAMHKAHAVHFPLARIVDGAATAPLAPPHPDFLQALGRTNDAIIYGGRVWLFVEGSAEEAGSLAEKLPSSTSRDYGEPFAAIFKRFNGDFYAIDPAWRRLSRRGRGYRKAPCLVRLKAARSVWPRPAARGSPSSPARARAWRGRWPGGSRRSAQGRALSGSTIAPSIPDRRPASASPASAALFPRAVWCAWWLAARLRR
jgi:methenyltetrahydromethanopterin cyclohydrolase